MMRLPLPVAPHGLLSGAILCALAMPSWAGSLNFTVTASEPVVVTGSPRIAISVGGVTRYATYASGSGTTSLSFGYQVQPGDFDANGITLAAPLELNGGTLADMAGNPMNPLSFTLPDTSALKVQTYTAAFTTSPITNTNANAVGFAIAKAPAGATFTYTITSSGGAGSITGSGTIGGSSHTVSGIDVSALPSGTLTLSVAVSTTTGGAGAARTDSTTPSFTGVLDALSSGAVAFSTRRMRSAYSGPLMRVRRSSDNAERDIAATVAGNLDDTGLVAFCGSASCFVRTWYDQSGQGLHAAQATTARQPRIVNAGTIESINGVPSPWFDGAGTVLVTPGPLASGSEVWSTQFIQVLSDGQFIGRVWGLNTNPSMAGLLSGDFYYGTSAYVRHAVTTTPRIVSLAVASGSSASMWVNGQQVSTSATGTVDWNGGQVLVVGNYGALNRAFHGRINTLYLGLAPYPAASRQAVERWLGAAAGIVVP